MKTGIGAWFHKPDGFEAVEIKTINTVLFVFAAAGVVTGGIVAGYYVFRPTEPSPTSGTLSPFLTTASRAVHF